MASAWTIRLASAAVLAVASASRPAPAARAAGDERLCVSAALGPTAGVAPARFETEVFGLSGTVDYPGPTQLKLVQTIDYRVLRQRSGPSVALEAQESLAGGHFLLQLVARASWSFRLPIAGIALYLAPGIGLGYVHFSRQADGGLGASGDGLTVQAAIEGRLFFGDRVFVLLRPVELDAQTVELTSGQVQDVGTFWRFDLLVGAGLTL